MSFPVVETLKRLTVSRSSRALAIIADDLVADVERVERERPKTRGDCVDGPRPCPFVGCRHHLALSVNPKTGSIHHAWDVDALDRMPATCSLDVADDGVERDQPVVARYLNVSHDRVRRVEERALSKLGPRMKRFVP